MGITKRSSFFMKIRRTKPPKEISNEKQISDTTSSKTTLIEENEDIIVSPTSSMNSKWHLSTMAFSTEGVRHRNEDRYFNKLSLDVPKVPSDLSCFAIFDGHAGEQCAEYFSKNIERFIKSCPIWHEEDATLEMKMRRAVYFAIEECEREFYLISKRANDTSGTCVVIGLYCDRNLCVANVGDCLSVLYLPAIDDSPERRIELSVPHRSRSPTERARIEEANGYVENFRALGVLEPSRTVGDFNIKEYRVGAVIAEPYVSFITIPEPPEDFFLNHKIDRPFLVFASDGLWDVVKREKVYKNTLKSLRKWRKNPNKRNTARHLVRTALRHQAMDDATVIVVHFDA